MPARVMQYDPTTRRYTNMDETVQTLTQALAAQGVPVVPIAQTAAATETPAAAATAAATAAPATDMANPPYSVMTPRGYKLAREGGGFAFRQPMTGEYYLALNGEPTRRSDDAEEVVSHTVFARSRLILTRDRVLVGFGDAWSAHDRGAVIRKASDPNFVWRPGEGLNTTRAALDATDYYEE